MTHWVPAALPEHGLELRTSCAVLTGTSLQSQANARTRFYPDVRLGEYIRPGRGATTVKSRQTPAPQEASPGPSCGASRDQA